MEHLVIPISQMEPGRWPLELECDLDRLDLGEWLRPKSALVVTGTVDRFGETLTIRGQARARVEEVCSRCTAPFERDLEAEFMVFADRRGSDGAADTRELEQQGELVYHDGIIVDITNPVREAIILSLPMNPLCREECRGLCAGCGADLNVEPCRCAGAPPDPRWEALRKLQKD